MEVDTPTLDIPVNIWCFLGKEGAKRVKANLTLGDTTLTALKEFVCKAVGSISPNEIDILYNGGKLMDDMAVKSATFRPMNVITVVKLDRNPEPRVDIAEAAGNIKGKIPQTALALRTAFLNPKFIPTIMKLGQSEMLENIMAIAPGLKNDPIAIAMIQDPAMIFHLADFESLKKLANTRPWVVEAFNFLAASVHQEKGGSRTNDVPSSGFFNPALLEDDDDDMDEDDDESGAGPSSRITREQLSAALNSLSALGRERLSSAPSQSQPSATGSSLFDRFSQGGGTSAAAGGGNPTADLTNLLSSLQQRVSRSGNTSTGAAGANPPALTPDLVARAMNTALNSLPAEAREARFSELRDQIARIQSMGSNNSTGATTSVVPPSSVAAPPTTPSSLQPLSVTSPYAQQLSQMRDMGINDERLSLLALGVSDGDVETAVELIFSGWTGEGADVEMPDEQ